MWGSGYNNYGGAGYGNHGNGGGMIERTSDNWIRRHVPGGLNSPMGSRLDNVLGGNPNPTYGQAYGYGHMNYGHHGHHHRRPHRW